MVSTIITSHIIFILLFYEGMSTAGSMERTMGSLRSRVMTGRSSYIVRRRRDPDEISAKAWILKCDWLKNAMAGKNIFFKNVIFDTSLKFSKYVKHRSHFLHFWLWFFVFCFLWRFCHLAILNQKWWKMEIRHYKKSNVLSFVVFFLLTPPFFIISILWGWFVWMLN